MSTLAWFIFGVCLGTFAAWVVYEYNNTISWIKSLKPPVKEEEEEHGRDTGGN